MGKVFRRAFSLAVGAAVSISAAFCNTYYVSPTGSDSAAGTKTAPFLTISKAAGMVHAGDTVLIHTGIYRETVTVHASGTALKQIIFMPDGSGPVTVSGSNPVTGWSQVSSSVYQAPLGVTPLGGGNDEVFFDGVMCPIAAYPHLGMDPLRPTLGFAAAGTTATTIVDPNLTQASGYWVGGRIWLLGGNQVMEPWGSTTGTITASSPGSLTIQLDPGSDSSSDCCACQGTPYYIYGGSLTTPAVPGEWTITGTKLNISPPAGGSPVGHDVEIKQRSLGFDLSNDSYIQVKDLSFFAASLRTNSSSDCTINGCSFSYVSHFTTVNAFWGVSSGTGVILNGLGNKLVNSIVRYSAGNGVVMQGSYNVVSNCVIRGCDYVGSGSAAIDAEGAHETITNNTIFECGRFGVLHTSLNTGLIAGNDISCFGMLTRDTGGTYSYNTNGYGTIITHNWCHDAYDTVNPGGRHVDGIFLDNGSSNYVVHHNLVWNTEIGLGLNSPSTGNLIANNDLLNKILGSSIASDQGIMTGSRFLNNIMQSDIAGNTGATWSNNIEQGTNPVFAAPIVLNYLLGSGSPGIEQGAVIPNVAPLENGLSPDIGAYQTGVTPWSAGSTLCPHAPVGLTATAGNGSITLTWSPVKGATSYNIYERTSANSFTLAGSAPTPVFTFNCTQSTTNYEFAVSSVGTYEGPHSASTYAQPYNPGYYPAESGFVVGTPICAPDTGATYGRYVGRFMAGSYLVMNNINGGTGGTKTLTIHYANNTSPQTLYISVNGGTAIPVSFPWTNGGSGNNNPAYYKNATVNVTLNAGSGNSIQIKSINGQTIGIDYFKV